MAEDKEKFTPPTDAEVIDETISFTPPSDAIAVDVKKNAGQDLQQPSQQPTTPSATPTTTVDERIVTPTSEGYMIKDVEVVAEKPSPLTQIKGAFLQGLKSYEENEQDYDLLFSNASAQRKIELLEKRRAEQLPTQEQNAFEMVAQTIGGTGKGMGKSILAGLVSAPATPIASVIAATGVAMGDGYKQGGTSAFKEAYYQAIDEGRTPEQAIEIAQKVGQTGAIGGATEGAFGGLPLTRAAQKIIKPTGKLMQKGIELAVDAFIDGSVAAGAQVGTNIEAERQGLKRELEKGAKEAFIGEAAFGTGMNLMHPTYKFIAKNTIGRLVTDKVSGDDRKSAVTIAATQPISVVNAALEESVKQGEITQQRANQITEDVVKRQKALGAMPSDVDLDEQNDIVETIEKRQELEKELEAASPTVKPFIEAQINVLDKSVAIPLPPKYIDTAGQNTSELKDGQLYITRKGDVRMWDAAQKQFLEAPRTFDVQGKKEPSGTVTEEVGGVVQPSAETTEKQGVEAAVQPIVEQDSGVGAEAAAPVLETEQTVTDDSQNIAGLPSEVGIGQESIETQPIESGGTETVSGGGDVQAQEEVVATPIQGYKNLTEQDAYKFLEQHVVEGKIDVYNNRPNFGLTSEELNRGIKQIRNKQYDKVGAKRILQAIQDWKEKGYVDYIQGGGGITVKTAIPFDVSAEIATMPDADVKEVVNLSVSLDNNLMALEDVISQQYTNKDGSLNTDKLRSDLEDFDNNNYFGDLLLLSKEDIEQLKNTINEQTAAQTEQGVSAVQEPIAKVESEIAKEQAATAAAEPTADVTFEEKAIVMPDGEDGIELIVTTPDGKAKSAGKFYTEDTKEIAKVKRGYDLQAKRAKIDNDIQAQKDALKKLLQSGDNLGIALDPKAEAKRQYQIHKTLVTLAKLYIQKGVQTVSDFANEVGIRIQDAQRAWDEALLGKTTTAQDIESNPYDVDYIKQNLLTAPQQSTAQTNLQADAISAISAGATNFQQFENAMQSNPDFNKLQKQSQQSLYFTAVSQYSNQQAVNQQNANVPPPATFKIKPQTWLEKIKFNFQDRLARLKDVQKQMQEAGIKIYDDANAALKYELLIGKARTKIQDKFEQVVKSKDKANPAILERLIAEGGDPDEFGIYMYAMHAPERNMAVANERQQEFDKAVSDLNDKITNASTPAAKTRYQNELNELIAGKGKVRLLSDGGSGMTNQQSAEIIKAVEDSGKKDLYDKYASEFRDAVIAPNLQSLLDYGLITKEQYDALTTKYTHYVPLQIVEKSLAKRIGAGASRGGVQGKDIFKAKGSDFYKFTERYNPLLSAMFAFNNTTIRGEKNAASQALLNLAELDADNEVFEIVSPKYTPIINSNGEVDYVLDATSNYVLDNSVRIIKDGKPKFVMIKDNALMEAFKSLGENRSIRQLQMVNSYLRSIATLLNPEFLFTNLARDYETALINIQSDIKDFDIKGATRFISNPKNLWSAGKGLVQDYKGNHKSEWAKTAKEYRENGGQVSWFQRETLDEFVADTNKEIAEIKKGQPLPSRILNSAAETFFLAQSTVEQSIRLATYKALRDRGVSAEKSALAAKNITVNFETKGKYGAFIDSLYLFANAGVQGSYRMLKSLATSRKAQLAAGALYAIGLTEAIINDILGGQDDEDEQISDAIKERNLVLVNPSNPSDPYFKFPLAYGANVFKHLGNLTYDVANDRKSLTDATAKGFLTIYNQFIPIQGATIAQALSPTFLDPFVQAIENRSFFDTPIYPEPNKYEPPKKDSDLYFQSVRPQSKWVADWLNENTGGSKVEAGKIDVSPEMLDHFYDALSGGTGRFIANIGAVGYGGYKYADSKLNNRPLDETDKIALRNVPFLRAFVGDTNEKRSMQLMYDLFERSAKEELTEKENEKFLKEVKLAVSKGRMDKKQAKRMIKTYYKGQRSIKAYKTE